MSIQIVKNASPPLTHTPMSIDSCLHEKLNKYEVLSYMNCHSTNLFIGKPKSGKSSLIHSLFNCKSALKKVYHKIYIFAPSSSRSSVSKDIFSTLDDSQQFYELNFDNLIFVLEDIKSLPKAHNKCIIFDDMSAYLKSSELQTIFKEICFNRRHLGVSIFFLAQTYYSIPKELRRVFSNLFIFKVPIESMRSIFSEQVEQNDDIIVPLMKQVYDKPYAFLFVNLDTQQMYKNWDRILISD